MPLTIYRRHTEISHSVVLEGSARPWRTDQAFGDCYCAAATAPARSAR